MVERDAGSQLGRVVGIRRYPVKAMGGEELAEVPLDGRGLVGDRWYAVQDDDGQLASGKNTRRFRRRDAVFDYRAVSTASGVRVLGPDVRGEERSWPVDSAELADTLSQRMGARVRLVPEGGVGHQDDGSVSLVGTATLDWCAQRWGIDADPRRLRVNLVVATGEPFVEESWLGRRLQLGSAVLRVTARIERCRTIDVSQDGAGAAGRWLKPLAAEREMCLAVYADVTRPGTVGVRDGVLDLG